MTTRSSSNVFLESLFNLTYEIEKLHMYLLVYIFFIVCEIFCYDISDLPFVLDGTSSRLIHLLIIDLQACYN